MQAACRRAAVLTGAVGDAQTAADCVLSVLERRTVVTSPSDVPCSGCTVCLRSLDARQLSARPLLTHVVVRVVLRGPAGSLGQPEVGRTWLAFLCAGSARHDSEGLPCRAVAARISARSMIVFVRKWMGGSS